MIVRTCPKCKSSIGEYDHYFCSSCGEKLPKELVRPPRPVRMRTYSNAPVESKDIGSTVKDVLKNKAAIYTAGLLIFIGVVLIGVFNTGIIELALSRISPDQPVTLTNLPEKVKKQNPVIVTEKDYLTGEFGDDTLASVAPSNVYYYFEGFDVVAFSQYFATDEDLSPLFSKADLLLEDMFAGFYVSGDVEGAVYVFVPTDADLVGILLEDVEDEEWFFEIRDDRLVLTDNEELFSVLDDVKDQQIPSLAQNTEFAKMKKELDTKGKIQVYFLHEEAKSLIRNSLGGLDQSTITDINEVISSDFESVIIK